MSCYPRNGSVADPGSPLLFLYHPKQQRYQSSQHPILWVGWIISTTCNAKLKVLFRSNIGLDSVAKHIHSITAQKMKFFINDFFSKCDQIPRKLQIWSHLLKKLLMENFIFCAVYYCCISQQQPWLNN